jgi:hypothetical protein
MIFATSGPDDRAKQNLLTEQSGKEVMKFRKALFSRALREVSRRETDYSSSTPKTTPSLLS